MRALQDFFRADSAVALVALTLILEAALFSWSFSAFFGSDSIFYLARKIDRPSEVLKILSSPDDRGQYRPLTLALFSFVFYPLFKLNPTGYHTIPLTFHCVNTILSYFLLRKLLREKLALLAATFYFGLHSINFFVSYSIAFLPDFTYFFFYVVSLLCFFSYQETGRRSRLILSFVSFVLSLLCKETAVTLPFLLLVCVFAKPGNQMYWARWKTVFPALTTYACILAVYLSFLISIKGGSLFPKNPADPYRTSFTVSTVAKKAEYFWWALSLPSGTGQLKGHPRVMSLLASIVPSRFLPYLAEVSNLFVRPTRLLRLVLMLPLVVAFALALKRLWRSERMVAGGLLWFLIALTPVLFLAVKTMRHNLYLPLLGIAAIMGLAVREAYAQIRNKSRGFATLWLAYFFVAYFTANAFAVKSHWKHAWPVKASLAAENSLRDLMQVHPSLEPDTTLYFLDNQQDDLVWLFEGGNLFRVFYRGPSLQFLFEQSGDELPSYHATSSRILILAYYEGHLYDLSKQFRAEAQDRKSYKLLEHFDPQLASFDHREIYILKDYLNTPGERPAFLYRFARGGDWRPAMVTVAGASVEFKIPKLEVGSLLRVGVTMVHDLGDGAQGRILFQSDGRREVIYSSFLNPAREPKHRRWFDESVDLSRFAGKEGNLRFECNSGPSADTAADWFAWSIMKIERK